MLTVEDVRAAALSDRPWEKLDQLVRAEMAAGRRVKDIATQFAAVADDVWGTPGLSEDGQDAFGDTYDALIGNCRRDQCYYDPPNETLPTEEEIAQLPRWARVAFAARCARRVLPLFTFHWPDDSEALSESLHWALTVPERVASDGAGSEVAAREAGSESAVIDRHAAPHGNACHVAAAISFAADTALRAIHAVQDYEDGYVVGSVVTAAEPEFDIRGDIRRDFDHLLNLSEYRHWDDDTPVPPDVFGPLWPEGAPDGWPADPDVPHRDGFVAAALVTDGVPPRNVRSELLNVFNAVNRYHIARTGRRLTLDGDLPLLLAALVPEGNTT